MSDRAESLLTLLLIGFCLMVALYVGLPRLLPRDVPVRFEAPDIDVSVSGEVARPGVYRLPFRSRVADLVELAGGLTPGAETSLVDLAATLGPGDGVHVPSRASPAGAPRVSVNSAPAGLLETLPGVGPVMALRIVNGRPYSRLDDLLRVAGIGEKTLERLRPFIGL
jgi:competence protein ComEA